MNPLKIDFKQFMKSFERSNIQLMQKYTLLTNL